jgi:hypothetical protein
MPVTRSPGVAVFPEHGETSTEILRRVDAARSAKAAVGSFQQNSHLFQKFDSASPK